MTKKVDFFDMLESVSHLPRLRIMAYVIQHCDPATGEFVGSYDAIAKATGTAYSEVVRTMATAVETKFLTPLGQSHWRLQDDFFAPNETEEPCVYVKVYGRSMD